VRRELNEEFSYWCRKNSILAVQMKANSDFFSWCSFSIFVSFLSDFPSFLMAATCPHCNFGRACFQQIQIRSADEPATTFYFCLNEKCGRMWREDWGQQPVLYKPHKLHAHLHMSRVSILRCFKVFQLARFCVQCYRFETPVYTGEAAKNVPTSKQTA